MKRALFISFFLYLTLLTPIYAGTTTLVTYYPAPSGNYNKMTINNSLKFPTDASSCPSLSPNQIALVNIGGNLVLCDSSGGTGTPLTPNNLWTYNSGSNYIYPASSTNPDAHINSLTVGLGGGRIASNSALGYQALNANTTGIYNSAVGYQTLSSNTIGFNNAAMGHQSLSSNISGNYNTALGTQTLHLNNTGNYNTAVGFTALYTNSTGNNNTAIGEASLYANTVGTENSAMGMLALSHNINGSSNTAMGYNALYDNSSGNNNTAVGYKALSSNTTGNNNAAIGNNALYANVTGHENTAIGETALYFNTTGYWNTALGMQALNHNTTGVNNTAVGINALMANTTGNNNAAIGENSGNECGLNWDCVTTQSGYLILGNSGTTNILAQVGVTVSSDARDKTDFASVPLGLNFVSQLKPIAFQYKTSRKDPTPAKDGRVHYGFLAQDILALEGNKPVIIDNRNPEYLMFNESSLVPVLVKAIQEMNDTIAKLTQENQELKSAINTRLSRLEAKVKN